MNKLQEKGSCAVMELSTMTGEPAGLHWDIRKCLLRVSTQADRPVAHAGRLHF